MSTAQIAADVNSRIDAMDAAATTAMSLLNGYMATLLDLAGLMPTYYTVADAKYSGTTPKFGDVAVPAFDQLGNAGSALNSAGQAVDSMTSLHPGITTLLGEFRAKLAGPEARLNAIAADVAVMPRPDVDFNEDNYIAGLIEDVKEQIMASLTQTPGGSTTGESTSYARDAVRRNDANQKELSDTLDEFASRGFRLPVEVRNDAAQAILARQAADERSADMEITVQMEVLSVENRQKAIDAGLRYDQILLAHATGKAQRALAAAKAALEIGQNLADMQFAVLDGLMGLQGASLAAVAEGRRIVMDDLRENTRTFGQKVDALISAAGAYIDAYQAAGQVYDVAKRAESEITAFSLSENEIHLKTLMRNIQNGVAAADDNLTAFSRISGIRLEAAKTGADLQTSLAKAVRRSITTVVQLLSGDKYSGTGAV